MSWRAFRPISFGSPIYGTSVYLDNSVDLFLPTELSFNFAPSRSTKAEAELGVVD